MLPGDLGELFIVLVRWIHSVGAVMWVGGSAFFALVIRPAAAADPEGMRRVMARLTGPYREMVDIAVVAIIISGLIMMFERLTGDEATVAYFVVLSVKLTLALWMFYLVWSLRRRGFAPPASSPGNAGLMSRIERGLTWLLGYNALLALGLVVFLLAGALRAIVEQAIRG